MSTWDRTPFVDLTAPPLNLRPRCRFTTMLWAVVRRVVGVGVGRRW